MGNSIIEHREDLLNLILPLCNDLDKRFKAMHHSTGYKIKLTQYTIEDIKELFEFENAVKEMQWCIDSYWYIKREQECIDEMLNYNPIPDGYIERFKTNVNN